VKHRPNGSPVETSPRTANGLSIAHIVAAALKTV
jgi:hypothetical protein